MRDAHAGRLRHRVRVEAPGQLTNDRGETRPDWLPVCECWAAIESGPGSEAWRAQTVQRDGAETVTVRHAAALALAGPKLRVVVLTQNLRVLNVAGVQWDAAGVWLTLNCQTEGRVAP